MNIKINQRLSQKFFSRSADIVAQDLLGKILCRKFPNGQILRGKIIETEAYFDEKDPASRASKGNNKVKEMMLQEPGKILIYNVHKYFMLNFVTDKKNKASAVLIRSIEPLNFSGRCSGPGLMTNSLRINKNFKDKFHGTQSCKNNVLLWVEKNKKEINKEKIKKSFRIGVSEDLKEMHRYYIKDLNK